MRAIAVTSTQPSALAPELPTVASAGLPGYELTGKQAFWVPLKTPASVINQLNKEIVRVLNQADIKEKILNLGGEVVANSPAQLTASMKADMARINKLGIRAE